MRLFLPLLIVLAILFVIGCRDTDDNRTFQGVQPPSNAKTGDKWVNPKDNSVLVYVPAGEFTMGANNIDVDASDDEKPAHKVYVDAFWIGKYPVTNSQFQKFVDATGYKTDAERCEWGGRGVWREDAKRYGNHPVTDVSWNDAKAYCQWAGLRLPTEAEWEKAARGIDERKYPWGNEWDADKCWPEESKPSEGPLPRTAPVDRFNGADSASPYGAMCMAGNIWEFCQDYYSKNYYQLCTASTSRNPLGPENAEKMVYVNDLPEGCRVLRGGSWMESKGCCRTTSRMHAWTSCSEGRFGFRVAYGKGPLIPTSDILTEMLDLSDRVAIQRWFIQVVPVHKAEEILLIDYDLKGLIEAQEHIIMGRYRKALAALDQDFPKEKILDQPSNIDKPQDLIHYMRGDIYYGLALLSLLQRGRYTIQPTSLTCYFSPDAKVKDLLVKARDAYCQADMNKNASQGIELDCQIFVIPKISQQHHKQVESFLDGHSDRIVVQGMELGIVAMRLSRLFTNDSEAGRQVEKIEEILGE